MYVCKYIFCKCFYSYDCHPNVPNQTYDDKEGDINQILIDLFQSHSYLKIYLRLLCQKHLFIEKSESLF